MKRLRPQLRSDVVLALFVTFAVVAAAAADWLQGEPPQGRLPVVVGFFPFLISALVSMGAAIQATDARRDPRWRSMSLIAAIVAASLADPTYATLLAVVPLIEIARRADEPERSLSIVAGGACIFWLAITEQSLPQRSGFESILVLAIVMTIVVMFGNALRRTDEARLLEARLTRQDERNRLARDIHDSLGHNLLASSIQLRTARALINQDPTAASNSIDLASRAVAEALAETRLVVDNNHAHDGSFSLESSLSGLVERTTTPEVSVSLDLQGDHRGLGAVEQMTLYRFAQEALANVIRHADASQASVSSHVVDKTATVTVADDGRGFDVASVPERTGLASLRERLARHGGSVYVSSTRGGGTSVTATIETPQ